MMSKQSHAKEMHKYNQKPVFPMCCNCKSYTFEMVDNGYGYYIEKNKRCSVGGFSVKKTATCEKHVFE